MLVSLSNIAAARSINRWRGKDVVRQIAHLLPSGGFVLDIGCGTGGVSDALLERGFEVVGVDNSTRSWSREVPFVVADAGRLPFRNKTFDVGLLFMVLHHSRYPEKVLLEAIRTCHCVLVGEEIRIAGVNWWLLLIYDKIAGFHWSNHPHNNRSEEQWRRTFHSIGLKCTHVERRIVFGFIRQAIFVLE